jgi:hypothetical protein
MASPFSGFGVYQLGDSRVYLPKGIESYLKWFTPKEEQECLAAPRRHSIVVLSPAALKEHREMMVLLDTDRESRLGDIGLPAHELTRAGRLAWPLTIGADRRFLLPKEARELGIVPAQDDAPVVLIAFRQVLEVWHPDYLPAQLQESVERWAELKERALRGLRAPES